MERNPDAPPATLDRSRRPHRAFGRAGGCGSTAGFDPSDLLDFLDTKKKLPGDRKPVFPEGVPGLEQGVPKDLYRGARQQRRPERAGRRRRCLRRPEAAEIQARREIQGASRPPPPPPRRATPDAAPDERRQRRRRAAGAQAGQDRAQAHHRCRRRSVRSAQPAQAPQQSAFPAPMPSGTFIADFSLAIGTPCRKAANGSACPSRLRLSAGPMSASRRCSTAWLGRSSRLSMTSPASPRPPRGRRAARRSRIHPDRHRRPR